MKLLKTSLLLASLFFFALVVNAQAPAPAAEGAVITFEEETHNFGELQQHGDASHEFKFTNTGTADLRITAAKGSCGCTVPHFSKDPVKPGESGTIRVVYDSKRLGAINKYVMVTSNATNGPTNRIYIKGSISAAPSFQAAPSGPMAAPATK